MMRIVLGLTPVLFCQLAYTQGVIAVYPSPTTVEKGTTRQFTTYVSVSPSGVTWSVNGITGGNATYGTITDKGLYSAPAIIPKANQITVRATSTAQPSIFGDSKVSITQPMPWVWSTYPSTFETGTSRQIKLNGSAFIPEAVVKVNGVAWATTYVNSTTLTAKGDLMQAGTFEVRVAHPDPGGVISQAVKITVKAPAPAPVTVTISPATAMSALGASTQFSASFSGTANMSVTWSASAGTITAAGLYTAPAAMPMSSSVAVRATSAADPTKFAQATVTLQSATTPPPTTPPPTTPPPTTPPPPPPPSGNNGASLSAARLLEQAAFGPSPAELASVQSKGITQWIDDQLGLPETVISVPAQSGSVQSQTLSRLAMAPDQLRQKMAWALGQIIVISMNKNIYPNEYVPYQQILSRNAFGNYRTLLGEIAVSPQMGKYLDIANSVKPGLAGGANENFARELMQLFTIGLYQLNPDGSQKFANGAPIGTYTQADVRQVALALTGWTYPTAPGAQPRATNWEEFSQPVMETRPANHDTSAKTLINGCTLAANQTVQQDMDGVLDCMFNHPNTPPFIVTRLIRSLVTSNPSAAYIQRISTVFQNNGSGVRGDLKAVLRAILLDPEARQDTAPPDSGRLKDPIYFIVSFVRAMNGAITPATQVPWNFVAMGETVTQPPSVFGYYSPLYRLPFNPTLFGPEFQIYTPTESVVEANLLYQMINQPNSDPSIDLSPFQAVAGNTGQLLDLVDQKLFYGRMPAGVRTSLSNAITASYDNTQRVQTAVYLAALSGQYQVQY